MAKWKVRTVWPMKDLKQFFYEQRKLGINVQKTFEILYNTRTEHSVVIRKR